MATSGSFKGPMESPVEFSIGEQKHTIKGKPWSLVDTPRREMIYSAIVHGKV
jgi:hypothetical protein